TNMREPWRWAERTIRFDHTPPDCSENSRRIGWRRRLCAHHRAKAAAGIRLRYNVRHVPGFLAGQDRWLRRFAARERSARVGQVRSRAFTLRELRISKTRRALSSFVDFALLARPASGTIANNFSRALCIRTAMDQRLLATPSPGRPRKTGRASFRRRRREQ